nr:macrolide ABC transporter permease/ATP-binding protein MacB [Vibrio cholerae]
LADEPTGALDSKSGLEMMMLLQELHQLGHTIIIVTHDMKVAEYANRIIEIKDGEILSDTVNQHTHAKSNFDSVREAKANHAFSRSRKLLDDFREAFKMALLAMSNHRLRTFL